jgi:hypothetical protein
LPYSQQLHSVAGTRLASLTDQQGLRFLLAILTAFFIVLVLAQLGTIRHRRFLARLIESQGSTIVEFQRLRGFMSPSKLLFWRDWTAYEIDAISPSGKATHYFVFLTGVAFCLFALNAELTTADDYILVVWESARKRFALSELRSHAPPRRVSESLDGSALPDGGDVAG